jgi:hypothetical protein
MYPGITIKTKYFSFGLIVQSSLKKTDNIAFPKNIRRVEAILDTGGIHSGNKLTLYSQQAGQLDKERQGW